MIFICIHTRSSLHKNWSRRIMARDGYLQNGFWANPIQTLPARCSSVTRLTARVIFFYEIMWSQKFMRTINGTSINQRKKSGGISKEMCTKAFTNFNDGELACRDREGRHLYSTSFVIIKSVMFMFPIYFF